MMLKVLQRIGLLLLAAWLLLGGVVVVVASSNAVQFGNWIVVYICACFGLVLPTLLLIALKKNGLGRTPTTPAIADLAAAERPSEELRPWRTMAAALAVSIGIMLGSVFTWATWLSVDHVDQSLFAIGITSTCVVMPAMLLWAIVRPRAPPVMAGQRFARSPGWTLVGTAIGIFWVSIAQLIGPIMVLFLREIPGLWARGDWLMAMLLTLGSPGLLLIVPFSLLLYHRHVISAWRWRRAPFAIVSADQAWLNGQVFERPFASVSSSSTRLGSMLNLQHAGKRHRMPLFALASSDEKPLLEALR